MGKSRLNTDVAIRQPDVIPAPAMARFPRTLAAYRSWHGAAWAVRRGPSQAAAAAVAPEEKIASATTPPAAPSAAAPAPEVPERPERLAEAPDQRHVPALDGPGQPHQWPPEAVDAARAIAAVLAPRQLEWKAEDGTIDHPDVAGASADVIIGSYDVSKWDNDEGFGATYSVPYLYAVRGPASRYELGTANTLAGAKRIAEDHWRTWAQIGRGNAPPPAPDDGDTEPKAEPRDLKLKAGPEGQIAPGATPSVAPERSMEQTPIPSPRSAAFDPGELPAALLRAKPATKTEALVGPTADVLESWWPYWGYRDTAFRNMVREVDSWDDVAPIVHDDGVSPITGLRLANKQFVRELKAMRNAVVRNIPVQELVETLVWRGTEISVYADTGPGMYSIQNTGRSLEAWYSEHDDDEENDGRCVDKIKVPVRLSKRAAAEAYAKLKAACEADWVIERERLVSATSSPNEKELVPT